MKFFFALFLVLLFTQSNKSVAQEYIDVPLSTDQKQVFDSEIKNILINLVGEEKSNKYTVTLKDTNELIARVNSSKEINLSLGILAFCDNVDQLSVILAHEISHEADFNYEEITRYILKQYNEFNADQGALYLLANAKNPPLSPQEMIMLFKKFYKLNPNQRKTFWSKHPHDVMRIAAANAWLSSNESKFYHLDTNGEKIYGYIT